MNGISTSQTHEEKSQLDMYLDEPARGLNEKLDVLEYWSKSSMRYPELAAMARVVLAVPVSSVASESAFSISRKVITVNRASLKPKTVEAFMCLQDWYRIKWEVGKRKGKSKGNLQMPILMTTSSQIPKMMVADLLLKKMVLAAPCCCCFCNS